MQWLFLEAAFLANRAVGPHLLRAMLEAYLWSEILIEIKRRRIQPAAIVREHAGWVSSDALVSSRTTRDGFARATWEQCSRSCVIHHSSLQACSRVDESRRLKRTRARREDFSTSEVAAHRCGLGSIVRQSRSKSARAAGTLPASAAATAPQLCRLGSLGCSKSCSPAVARRADDRQCEILSHVPMSCTQMRDPTSSAISSRRDKTRLVWKSIPEHLQPMAA